MRITIKEVKDYLGISASYDIVNAIRNSSTQQFQNYVPLASLDNIDKIGAGILINQATQNEFITNLVDRIAKVVVRRVSLNNPLKKFKKGQIPQGKTIEEIFTDITKANQYDPEGAVDTVYRRVMPNVKTLFHERNRQEFYKQTIQDDSLKTAFTSWNSFDNFLSSIISAIYNSAEVDEYEYMKLLVDNYYAKGLFNIVPVAKPDNETATTAFVKKVRQMATLMTIPTGSREYNSLAVRTRSDIGSLHLIISAQLQAELDVDVLAKAFNMDKATFMGHVTVIDGFESTGLEAVLVDESFFMVYDNNYKMETLRNPEGLYWNYWLHVWQTYSVSRFANAVAFSSDPALPLVTQVIVSPTIAAVKPGKTFEFDSYIRQTDDVNRTVTWGVVGSDGSTTVKAGTTIDSDGVLTVASDQTGELRVTATVAGAGVDTDGAGADTADVIGEAIVTILPATVN